MGGNNTQEGEAVSQLLWLLLVMNMDTRRWPVPDVDTAAGAWRRDGRGDGGRREGREEGRKNGR